MHLIFSNIITEKRLWNNKDVTKNNRRGRASMAASTLQSMTKLQIDSADMFLEFDETSESIREPLLDFIKKLPFPVSLHEYRLDSYDLWRKASLNLKGGDSGQVLLFTNEDHLFLPGAESEFEFMSALQSRFQKDLPDKLIMVPLSHFPESHATIPLAKLAGRLIQVDRAPLVPCQIPAGPILLSESHFQRIWEEDFTKGSKFVGLENPFGNSLRLTNGYYLPPRSELFRHFDSYGHVKLNFWPYNLIEPNVQVMDGENSAYLDFQYELSTSLTNPEGDLPKTLASGEESAAGQDDKFAMSILKAGLKRPSSYSFRWVATMYKTSEKDLARILWLVWKSNINFRKAVLARLWNLPGHLLLGVVGRFTSRLRSVDLEYIWFLTYGSGVGFVRLFRLSWPNLLRKIGLGVNKK